MQFFSELWLSGDLKHYFGWRCATCWQVAKQRLKKMLLQKVKNNNEALFDVISLANIWEAKEKFGCPKQRAAHTSGNRRRRCTEVRWTWPHILAEQGGPLTDTHGRDPGHTFHSAINMQACLQYWKQGGAASRHSLNVQQAKLNKQMNWTTARSFKEEKKREGERRWLAGCPSERRGGGDGGLLGDRLAALPIRREQPEEKSIEGLQPSGRA